MKNHQVRVFMNVFNRPMCAIYMAVLLAFCSPIWASSDSEISTATPASAEAIQQEAETQRRSRIINHAQDLFTLLNAELAWEHGKALQALGGYLSVFKSTKDPEVAERAIELAISIHANDIADEIYKEWQLAEPNPSPAQTRIAWLRALSKNDADTVLTHIDSVFAQANGKQKTRLFELLASVASHNQPETSAKLANKIHTLALENASLPEAASADLLYSVNTNHQARALLALKRLSQATQSELSPLNRAWIIHARERKPEWLQYFFTQNDSKQLPQAWQELEIAVLLAQKDSTGAYQRVQKLLQTQKASSALYLQAAMLSVSEKEKPLTTIAYLKKAYELGDNNLKSRAAIMLSMQMAEEKNYPQAHEWLNRVQDESFEYDKNALRILLAGEQKKWKEVIELSRKTNNMGEQGMFFHFGDIYRVYVYAITQTLSPIQSATELGKLIQLASKHELQRNKLAELLYQRALLYANKLNNLQQAISDLKRYLEIHPDSATGLNALGYSMLETGVNVEEAFDFIQRAYKKEPDNAQINDSLGWAYYKKGDANAALTYLEYAFEQDKDPEVAGHLGTVYWELGRKDEARKIWQQALSKDKNNKALRKILQQYRIPTH